MGYQFTNNASSTLVANLSSIGTTVNITPADASKYAIPSGADFFMATLQKSTGEFEIVKVTANPLDGSFTIVRAQEGTAAIAFVIGDFFSHRLTAGALNSFPQKDGTVQANLNAHKVNGIEAATTAQANKLLACDGDGELAVDIKGNAATATTADELLGVPGTEILQRANHTGNAFTLQVFTADGTWNKPNGCDSIEVTLVGGGGAAGAGDGIGSLNGSSGGDGGMCIGVIDVSAITSLAVQVGAGGVGVVYASGGAGGNGASSTMSTLTAAGGSGGVHNGADGADGSGSGGAVNYTGNNIPIYGNGGAGSNATPGQSGQAGIVIVREFY